MPWFLTEVTLPSRCQSTVGGGVPVAISNTSLLMAFCSSGGTGCTAKICCCATTGGWSLTPGSGSSGVSASIASQSSL